MIGAVTGSEDVRRGGSTACVDEDAVVARNACGFRKLDIGHDADADDHEICVEHGCAAVHLLDSAIAGESCDRRVRMNMHAASGV